MGIIPVGISPVGVCGKDGQYHSAPFSSTLTEAPSLWQSDGWNTSGLCSKPYVPSSSNPTAKESLGSDWLWLAQGPPLARISLDLRDGELRGQLWVGREATTPNKMHL